MPIAFANPALLFGGLLASVPVIIHFLSRKKVVKQKFSDLRFLDEVQARQARSLGIRRWLLLLLRVLAILAVVFAVSGPRWGGLASGASGARSLIFIIDNSASMNTQQESGSRLDQALADCRHMIAGLPADAQVQVVVSGSRTTTLFGDWLPAGAIAGHTLAGVQPSDGSFDLAAALRKTARLVKRAPSQPVEMILVSDFQQNPLPGTLKTVVPRLLAAGDVHLITRAVGQAVAGGGVENILLPQRALRQGEDVEIQAEVTSNLPDQVFSLEIDGENVAEAVLHEPSRTPTPLKFSMSVPGPGFHGGRVRKSSDAFADDDARPFVLAVPHELPVLVVHGRDRAVDHPAGRGGWRYLAQALAPGGQAGVYRVRPVDSNQLTSGDLATCAVAVFVDPDPLGRRTAESLRTWLETGGAAVFLVGDPTLVEYLDSTLLPLLGLEPGTIPVRKKEGQQLRVQVLVPEHPVFQGLGNEAIETFEDISWSRWLRLPGVQTGVLLQLADESPLLLSSRLADGHFVVLPFDLSPAASGLVASPMALPFFQRLVSWLSVGGRGQSAVNVLVGQQAKVSPAAGTEAGVLEDPEQLRILDETGRPARHADLVWQGDRAQLVGDVLDRAEILAFLAGTDTLGMVAAQVPAAESVVELWKAADWARQLDLYNLPVAGQLSTFGEPNLSAALNGRNLAPWLFGLAFLLLFVELFVGRGTGNPESAPA